MQIDLDLLYTWGAIAKQYAKHEIIFEEDAHAHYYHQIISGGVRMYNTNEEGKEFTQGVFCQGQSFGEPAIIIDKTYPARAETIQDSVIIKLSKENFFKLLDEYPLIQKSLLRLMATRIHTKSNSSKEIINQNPEFRLLAFINTFKKSSPPQQGKLLIPFTRQEIANFTGLRVETVIRAFSKLNASNKIEIINHKVYF